MNILKSVMAGLIALSATCAMATETITMTNSSDLPRVHPYDQMLSFNVGRMAPKSVSFTNWNGYSFDYDESSRRATYGEIGYGIHLFSFPTWSFVATENVGYSSMSYKLPTESALNYGDASVTMHLFSLDTRLVGSWQNSRYAALVPFVEAGYRLTLYTQQGGATLLSADGSAGNPVGALGARLWINRSSSINEEYPSRYRAIPVFLSAKLNQIFTNDTGMDMAGTSVLVGMTVGL